MSTEVKTASLGQMKKMSRCHRSWKKTAPKVNTAVKGINNLGIFQRDAAFSHFIGGAQVQLEFHGTISRQDFIRLMESASQFGAGMPHL